MPTEAEQSAVNAIRLAYNKAKIQSVLTGEMTYARNALLNETKSALTIARFNSLNKFRSLKGITPLIIPPIIQQQ